MPVAVAFRGLAADLPWRAETLDLLDVAAAVLVADRSVRRAGNLPRRLRLSLPVRRPGLWREVAPDLTALLEFITRDQLELEFRPSRSPSASGARPAPARITPRRLERVALFSGGLDSAAAAAIFARQDRATGFVSHYVTGIRRLERLLHGIGEAYGGQDEPAHAGFYLSPAPGMAAVWRENSRRSRSFLFACLAVVTAAGTGANEIAICENGPLALNLPLSPAMVPTRHAHSRFLLAVEVLARRLLDRDLRVVNPFELQTKGEMTRVFADHPSLALATTSCWYQQWSGRGRHHARGHCGLCLPCLVRRAALVAADIPIPARHFDVDVLQLAHRRRKSVQDRARLGHFRLLLRFGRELRSCATWRSFLERFPEVVESRPTAVSLPWDAWFPSLFDLMRRFADEIEGALPISSLDAADA